MTDDKGTVLPAGTGKGFRQGIGTSAMFYFMYAFIARDGWSNSALVIVGITVWLAFAYALSFILDRYEPKKAGDA